MSSQSDPLAGLYADEEEDPLAGLYAESDTSQGKSDNLKEVAGPYYVEEKTPEELKAMSVSERLQYTDDLNVMRQYLQSKGFTKGLLSGASFGFSENVPGLKPQEGELSGGFGELTGSLLPITGLFKVFGGTLGKLAARSPYFQQSLNALANITGAGLAGGTYGGLEHAAKTGEVPSTNNVLEHGFEWAALDALLQSTGLAGRFAVNLVKAARKTKQPEWKVVNDVYNTLREQGVDIATDKRAGAKAMTVLEDMQATKPEGRKFKANEVSLENVDELAEPILPEARQETINVNNLIESSEEKAIRDRIDSVGRRTIDDAELGKEIQEGINSAREAAKQEYKPFYDEVDEGARYIIASPTSTARVAGDLLPIIEDLYTKPAGYRTVIDTLENVLKDIGYLVQRNEQGVIENIIQQGEIPLNKLMDLGRRLGEIVDYDVLEFTIKDRLKPVVKAVKDDVKASLRKVNPDLETAFELAEEAYGIVAEKFGRESVYKIRGTQALENIPKQLESATALKDLRAIISPKAMQNVERDLLEKMSHMNERKAQDFLRKIRSGLSKESQKIADDLIRAKRPVNREGLHTRRDRLMTAIDDDLGTAMNTGKRPVKTLEMWQNPRGQKLVKEALETHPQKKEILQYLQQQTLEDMVRSIVNKEGMLDIKKLSELMDNPAIRENLRELGGQEAVNFFRELDAQVNGLQRNTNELITEKLGRTKDSTKKVTQYGEIKEAIDQVSKGDKGKSILGRMAAKDFPLITKINNALNQLGLQSKIAFNVFTLLRFGFVKAMGVPFAAKVLKKLATSREAREAFKKASRTHRDPLAFIVAMENLGEALNEE